jgi:hypothetical protein
MPPSVVLLTNPLVDATARRRARRRRGRCPGPHCLVQHPFSVGMTARCMSLPSKYVPLLEPDYSHFVGIPHEVRVCFTPRTASVSHFAKTLGQEDSRCDPRSSPTGGSPPVVFDPVTAAVLRWRPAEGATVGPQWGHQTHRTRPKPRGGQTGESGRLAGTFQTGRNRPKPSQTSFNPKVGGSIPPRPTKTRVAIRKRLG